VSGTGLLGICTSGGTVLYTAAKDKNVGAVATVAGSFTEPDVALLVYGGPDGGKKHRDNALQAKEIYERTGVIQTIRAYHDTDKTAANVRPMDYYLDMARENVPEYRNAFAVMAWAAMLDFAPSPRLRT
jgi:dienelactone hydrolase